LNYTKKIDASRMLYSCCSGYNFYFWQYRRSCEVFRKRKSIIQHVKTEEYFYITPFPDDLNNDVDLNYWVELIRKPVDLKHYIWPVDIITLPDSAGNAIYALVFPIRALPVFENISTLLTNEIQAGWNMQWVQKLIANLLDAWCHFDDSKYAYHEFSVDNMFYQKENFNVMFDFSFSTHKTENLYDTRPVSKERITPDYTDSYYYLDTRNSLMDLASDYYSIAVILFKLMIGILPYQGKVMEHEPNTSELEHKNWLRIYHKNTYFIFDLEDETNHIGGETGFAKDEIFVGRWKELPEHIRNMFHNVFQTANVLRTANNLIFYSPHQWKEALFGESPAEVKLDYRVSGVNMLGKTSPKQKVLDRNNTPETAFVEEAATATVVPTQEKADLVTEMSGILRAKESEQIGSNNSCPCGSGKKYKNCCGAATRETSVAKKTGGYYDVILMKTSAPEKIVTLKVIREITGLGLAQVKDLSESAPHPIVQGVSESLAKQIQAELLLVKAETKLTGNTKQNEQLETYVWQRMQGRWQSKV
jgi:ribosomal protein L7/L12